MPATSPEAKARHAEYMHERYRWYKAHGICTNCFKRFSEPGRVQCGECIRRKEQKRARMDPDGALRKAKSKAYRAEKIAAGLCTDCGVRKVAEGRRHCEKCLRKRRENDMARRVRERIQREATRQ